MGNSNDTTQRRTNFKDFNMQKYLNQGLNQQQILQIREAFQTYDPVNGEISLEKLKLCTEQSSHKEQITKILGNKQKINFDEFFAMSKQLLNQELSKNPGMVIDGT